MDISSMPAGVRRFHSQSDWHLRVTKKVTNKDVKTFGTSLDSLEQAG